MDIIHQIIERNSDIRKRDWNSGRMLKRY